MLTVRSYIVIQTVLVNSSWWCLCYGSNTQYI